MVYKIQIVSRDDIAEGLIYDLWREGHKIYYRGRNPHVFENMEGIEKVKQYQKGVDYYIFDDTLFGIQIEELRGKGYDVVGGNRIGDKLEMDRLFFTQTMEKIGVKVPETHGFKSISEGIKFLKENGGKWVFKPSGKWSDEKSLTYVGDDIIDFMENVKEKYGDKNDYVLQRFIEGVEVAITAMVIDGKVVGGYFVNFEVKPFMRFSNLNTGEVGTIVKYYDYVPKLSDYLQKAASVLGEYRCWFDLNGILTEDGEYYVLEPTSRFGVPIFAIIHSMLDEDLGEFYAKVAKGELENYNVKDGWFVGIVLAVPPFPHHIPNQWAISQLPIHYGRMEDKDVHYFEIMKKDGEFWTSGDNGYVAVVVGKGEDWKRANDDAVRKARGINIPEKFFRWDIGLDERPKIFTEKFI